MTTNTVNRSPNNNEFYLYVSIVNTFEQIYINESAYVKWEN